MQASLDKAAARKTQLRDEKRKSELLQKELDTLKLQLANSQKFPPVEILNTTPQNGTEKQPLATQTEKENTPTPLAQPSDVGGILSAMWTEIKAIKTAATDRQTDDIKAPKKVNVSLHI